MNYSSFIVKIIDKPEQSFFREDIAISEILVKFAPIQKKAISFDLFTISIWGNLSYDAIKYYNINDYILIEGYISLRENVSENKYFTKDKQIDIAVFKMYPFIFSTQK